MTFVSRHGRLKIIIAAIIPVTPHAFPQAIANGANNKASANVTHIWMVMVPIPAKAISAIQIQPRQLPEHADAEKSTSIPIVMEQRIA